MSESARAERAAFDAASVSEMLRADPDAGIAEIRRAARSGDVGAQALLGQIFLEGRGVAIDEAEGLHWHAVAASAGNVESMNMVGRCHELGRGTPIDEALAAVWYRKAANAGLDWGIYNYANLLATGRGIARDRPHAFALYRRAAAMGHAKSMNFVGRHYDEGWDVERDPEAAVDWYRRSAEGGDFRGQASYASVLAHEGRFDEAQRWLVRAIETGSAVFLETLARSLADSPHESFRALVPRIEKRLKPARV
jgi:TPR repeat protein